MEHLSGVLKSIKGDELMSALRSTAAAGSSKEQLAVLSAVGTCSVIAGGFLLRRRRHSLGSLPQPEETTTEATVTNADAVVVLSSKEEPPSEPQLVQSEPMIVNNISHDIIQVVPKIKKQKRRYTLGYRRTPFVMERIARDNTKPVLVCIGGRNKSGKHLVAKVLQEEMPLPSVVISFETETVSSFNDKDRQRLINEGKFTATFQELRKAPVSPNKESQYLHSHHRNILKSMDQAIADGVYCIIVPDLWTNADMEFVEQRREDFSKVVTVWADAREENRKQRAAGDDGNNDELYSEETELSSRRDWTLTFLNHTEGREIVCTWVRSRLIPIVAEPTKVIGIAALMRFHMTDETDGNRGSWLLPNVGSAFESPTAVRTLVGELSRRVPSEVTHIVSFDNGAATCWGALVAHHSARKLIIARTDCECWGEHCGNDVDGMYFCIPNDSIRGGDVVCIIEDLLGDGEKEVAVKAAVERRKARTWGCVVVCEDVSSNGRANLDAHKLNLQEILKIRGGQ